MKESPSWGDGQVDWHSRHCPFGPCLQNTDPERRSLRKSRWPQAQALSGSLHWCLPSPEPDVRQWEQGLWARCTLPPLGVPLSGWLCTQKSLLPPPWGYSILEEFPRPGDLNSQPSQKGEEVILFSHQQEWAEAFRLFTVE